MDYAILLEKLKLYGFSQNAVKWFKSYLDNRYQQVTVESSLSDPIKVDDQGVPRGSLWGPLCFLIFYNDFPVTRNEGVSVLYADDNTDNVSSGCPIELNHKIQAEADLST